jgi:Xaa-Pro aminopeptidase
MNQEEIEKRLKGLREKILERGIEGALIFSHLNLYYFTGLWIKGFLFLTKETIKIFVKRPYSQVKKKEGLPIYFFESLKNLPEILKKASLRRIGLEYRAFSLGEGERLKKTLTDFEIFPIDSLIWELRMIKSPYEIQCQKRASQLLSQALREALSQFKEGMREIAASALLEKALRVRGHPGYTRSFNGFELAFGYLISGKEGLFAIPFTTGEGGTGLEGFPGGASFKKIKRGEPILIDYGGFYKGYYIDQTRMASFGECKKAEEFFKASMEILKTLEKKGKPGVPCEELFFIAEEIADKRGFREYFMKHGDKINFIGHGVGLEIDEPPVIVPGNKGELKENMVLAFEPKFHVPELGVVGLEDTFVVTNYGLKRLTTFPRKWIHLN